MEASNKTLAIGSRFIGSHNIIRVETRGQQHDAHIRVVFQHSLEHDIRRQIEEMAFPVKVRFIDAPLKIIEKRQW